MQTTSDIMNIFQGFRMQPTPIDQYESVGKQILHNRIDSFVTANKPINFVMLGFPFKSTNIRDKVIGTLPDMGEELTLNNFTRFNDLVKKVYNPGITLAMASDGYVFNDILHVDDNIVQQYKEVSMDLGKQSPVMFYDLNDFYEGASIAPKRDKVMTQFGISQLDLEQKILFDADVNYLYRGMIRFMQEELADKNYPSGNQLHKAAKQLTREMMLRNEAYSNLVKKEFSSCIRLSMHPSINNGAKYSFQLIPSPKANMSAWHCAILIDDTEVSTIHRKDAEQAGYTMIYKDNRPYYFTTNK